MSDFRRHNNPNQLELPLLPGFLAEVRPPWRGRVLLAELFEEMEHETRPVAPLRPVTLEDPITDEDIPF